MEPATYLVLVFGFVFMVVFHGEDLCKDMGGTYKPEAAQVGKESCEGGKWRNLLDSKPEQKK